MPDVKVTVDLSQIDEKEFDPQRPLLIAAVKGGKIIDQKTVVPAKEKNPRNFTAQVSLGPAEDNVAGAEIVVAPADDERNVFSDLVAKKFVSQTGDRLAEASIRVNSSIYTWWRFCWFPRSYRITGRLQRHVDDCAHPIGGARVDILDVDYCWWWFNEDLITSGYTDANGFFDIRFTWCVPLWCLFVITRFPPLAIDPDLRDRIRAVLAEKVRIKFPPPPPPDPWEWEKQLMELGIELPAAGRPNVASLQLAAARQVAPEVKTGAGRVSALPVALPAAPAPRPEAVTAANAAA